MFIFSKNVRKLRIAQLKHTEYQLLQHRELLESEQANVSMPEKRIARLKQEIQDDEPRTSGPPAKGN